MIKLTITAIGTPRDVQTKFGLKQSNYIKAQEYGNEFLNYFLSDTTKDWVVGKVIEVENVEKRDYTSKKDGSLKTSFDIKLPRSGNAELYARIEKLEGRVTLMNLDLQKCIDKITELTGSKDDGYPTAEKEGLDPKNMANFDLPTKEEVEKGIRDYHKNVKVPGFDHTADGDMGPIDDNFGT